MATHLRTLLNDTSRTYSILKLCDLKSKVNFISTVRPITDLYPIGLCLIRIEINLEFGDKAKYVAALNHFDVSSRLAFDDWWQQIVVKDEYNNSFTRRDLVINVADKDGGAHVDLSIGKKYKTLKYEDAVGITFYYNGKEQGFENDIVFSSIRQIVYEVLFSLYEYSSDLFEGDYFGRGRLFEKDYF